MRWRHTIFRGAVAVVAGVGISIGVALAFASRGGVWGPRNDVYRFFERFEVAWSCVEMRQPGKVTMPWEAMLASGEPPSNLNAIEETRRAAGVRIRDVPWRGTSDKPPWWGSLASDRLPRRYVGQDNGFGWPLPCLWHRFMLDDDGRMALEGHWSLTGDPRRSNWTDAIPARIVWKGLAVDTAVYSIVAAAVFFGPGAVRRARRRRRGWCVRCGYDLRGAAGPCPECGAGRLVSGDS
jgi:hypothetical protein